MTYFLLLATAIVFFFIGWVIESIRPKKPDGLLNIDKRDAEKDFWDFVLLVPPEDAERKRDLRIEVHIKS